MSAAGRTILITGASSGIGEELAYDFARPNNRLLLLARNVERLGRVAEKCRKLGATIVEVAAIDVSDRPSMDAWIRDVDSRYNIDLIIANAGVMLDQGPDDMRLSVNTEVININIMGVINTIQPCISAMQERGNGDIVIISSVAGFASIPNCMNKAMAAYCASKRFLRVYGEGIRPLYAAKNVRVHTICPALINTAMTDASISDISMSASPPSVVVDAVRRALYFNTPLVMAPKRSTLLYLLFMPFIPFTLYSSVLIWAMNRINRKETLSIRHSVSVNPRPKNILITGASSGLGSCLAQEYASHNTHLMLFGTNNQKLEEVAEKCRNKKAETSIYACDVKDELEMSRNVLLCDSSHEIDLVIANAGVSGGVAEASFEDTDQIEEIIRVNILGVLNTVDPLISRMKERKKGQIVIISSFLAFRGIPGQPAYCASKAALVAYAESLAMELSTYNIGLTVVCCGYMDTPMSAGTRFFPMDPRDCARRIKIAAARDVRIALIPVYLGGLMHICNSLLPRRFSDWLVAKFFPRRNPMKK